MNSTAPVLDRLQAVVDSALGSLKTQCSIDGVFDASLLDAHQLPGYELAFCAAEISAARVLNEYALEAGKLDPLCTDVALAFTTETVQSVSTRLLPHCDALGLERQSLFDLLDRDITTQALANIGVALSQRGHGRLPSLLDPDKEMVRDSFARFADEVVAPQAEAIHRQDLDIPDSLIQAAAEMGCFGSCIPQRFGGTMPDEGSDSLGMIVVTEELSRASLGAAGSLITRPEIAARALLSGGTAQQQQYWLPKLASAESLCAIAVTEPDYGSDVASVALKARPTDGGWLLNGSKTWCTFAGKANLVVTLARTDPDPTAGHRGLSLFLVEKPAGSGHQFEHIQTEGGKLNGKAIATLGYRGMHSFDLFFENYFVPADQLVGVAPGKGFYHAMTGFSGGRIQTAARATGVMQAALEQAISYANERKVFGAAVADYQLTQVKLARMLTTLTAARQFSYAVARLMDSGAGQMEASLVKLFSCRAAEWITREAMQIHGGMGYAEESPVSRYFVDARVLSIFEGAEETLALKVIARDLVSNANEQ
jgi:(2S)-methylsuccinyl-CoA dehydrogenase